MGIISNKQLKRPPLPKRVRRWLAVCAQFPHVRRAAVDLCRGHFPDDPHTIALDDAELARLVATLCTLDGDALLLAAIGPDMEGT